MEVSVPRSSLTPRDLLACWAQILAGRVPMMSIEITRRVSVSCPGCYAYGDTHLQGTTLRQLNDLRGEDLVDGVLGLVRQHRPLHVSLVGGEPSVRHRELTRILPQLEEMGVFTMVVTSAVIPIPEAWMSHSRLRVAVSVDGLPEHHDERREARDLRTHFAKYCWTKSKRALGDYAADAATSRMLETVCVSFWNTREEVDHVWVSLSLRRWESRVRKC